MTRIASVGKAARLRIVDVSRTRHCNLSWEEPETNSEQKNNSEHETGDPEIHPRNQDLAWGPPQQHPDA